MFGIVKKNLPLFTLYLLPMTGLMALWQIDKGYLDTSRVLMIGFFIILFTSGAVTTSEQTASKNKEYQFLKSLPLKDSDIVAAKFMLALFSVLFCLGISMALVIFLDTEKLNLPLTWFYLGFCGSLALLMSAFWYVFIYSHGIGKTLKLLWIVMIACFSLPILLDVFVISRGRVKVDGVIGLVTGLPVFLWLVAVVCVFYVYFMLMKWAVRIKSEGLKGFE